MFFFLCLGFHFLDQTEVTGTEGMVTFLSWRLKIIEGEQWVAEILNTSFQLWGLIACLGSAVDQKMPPVFLYDNATKEHIFEQWISNNTTQDDDWMYVWTSSHVLIKSLQSQQ